jgi:hypothetical protein
MPFLERYNNLRLHFENFDYRQQQCSNREYSLRTAFDLLTRISVEPVVARYIRNADFKVDSFFVHHTPREVPVVVPDVHSGGPLVKLLAGSPYLEQAGLDWKEYYAEIEKDLKIARSRYSQHAATFLLTLLLTSRILSYQRHGSRSTQPTGLLMLSFARPSSRVCLATALASPRLPDLSHLAHSIPRKDFIWIG